MKSHLNIILASIILVVLAYFTFNKPAEATPPKAPKLAMNFVKCTSTKFLLEDVDTTKQISPLFKNLGNLHFSISTENERAQAFFDQGLKLSYAFNHAEAHRSFMEASRLDPNSAMAYWGQAFTLGPNINDPLPPEERKIKINEAITKAQQLASKASLKEQVLIEALSNRYSNDLTADIPKLNMMYMHAMTKAAAQFPEDANIQILYAASVMNTVPWNYWDKDGNPSPNIKVAKAALEKAMLLEPENPGGHHYYIHMVELPYPDIGVKSADKLASLMPGAGHIVHMPSHIYIRVGRYKDAVITNQKAILADEDYISQCFAQGLYPLGYYPHNIHFLWSSASLLGASDVAIDAAKKTAEKVPVGEFIEMPFLQDFAATPLLAYTRFGKWNEILTIPAPKSEIKHLNLMRHYARGIAFIRKGNIKEAQEELDAIVVLKNDPELETLIATANNASIHSANIAYEVVAGELEALKGNIPKAIEHLENAVVFEDDLTYTEPAAWHIPTRQNLGAILLKAKKYDDAEKVYEEDLNILRQNGWSLIGLYKTLKAQGKNDEADIIKKEFDIAWKDSDIKIDNSVL
ncbi:tetratricopeptide repeat protein [Winogradskyella schleiferi]|uniref:tetratricopeptide repeat protein n=1 Tax=Winogradskyella schleiferi TaxID=2686078 RepID=UPI0015B8C9F7|nr:tetratricopeptide repeat protein [Winogradskyella schleiferi]